MTKDEMTLIQKYFQLHSLIAEDEGDSEQANQIREEMEILEQGIDGITSEYMGTISCYCYALTSKDPELRQRYRDLLFANTVNMDDLNAIWESSK